MLAKNLLMMEIASASSVLLRIGCSTDLRIIKATWNNTCVCVCVCVCVQEYIIWNRVNVHTHTVPSHWYYTMLHYTKSLIARKQLLLLHNVIQCNLISSMFKQSVMLHSVTQCYINTSSVFKYLDLVSEWCYTVKLCNVTLCYPSCTLIPSIRKQSMMLMATLLSMTERNRVRNQLREIMARICSLCFRSWNNSGRCLAVRCSNTTVCVCVCVCVCGASVCVCRVSVCV